MAVAGLVGRDEELAAIRRLSEFPHSDVLGLVLTGEPGIGKTVLWEAGIDAAVARGCLVLSHRSVQAEAGFAFAGLSDLVGPIFDEVSDSLLAPRRDALAVALRITGPGTEPPQAHAIGLGFLDALTTLAEHRPVLVALDDLQWLDASSAAVCAAGLRRLATADVRVLATRRVEDGGPDVDPLHGVELRQLRLEPLDLTATQQLIRDRLELDVPRPVLMSIYGTSGGNPYFALELVRATEREEPLKIPNSLRALLGERLDDLPAETLDVLLHAAALAEPTEALLDQAHDDPRVVADGLQVAALHRVVTLDGSAIRFTHPLLASLCYERAPPWRRRAVHARLAELIPDPEQRARHLALAAGDRTDEGLAASLDHAAQLAAERGATAAAADLTELALRHTPIGSPAARRSRLAAAGWYHRMAGDPDRAGGFYGQALEDAPPGPERADLLYASAALLRADTATRIAQCEQALLEAGDDDARSARILGYLALSRWLAGDTATGLVEARTALASAERLGDARLLVSTIAFTLQLETFSLDDTPGLLERGMALEKTLDAQLMYQESPRYMGAIRLIQRDRLDEARITLDDFVARAVEVGDEQAREFATLLLIVVEHQAGHLDAAMLHADRVRQLAGHLHDPQLHVMASRFIGALLADIGRVEETRRVVDDGLATAREISDQIQSVGLLADLGHLELARGDLESAISWLDDLPERHIATGHLDPGLGPWADTVETLIGLGRLDRAAGLLATFEELAERSSRWAMTGAARCRGLLHLAHGDEAAAVEALQGALEAEGGMYPIERGRALTALGITYLHARRRRDARATLEAAICLFEDIGSTIWCERARRELRRVGGRRPQGDDLTVAEQRVAELAARGLHNKEIATMLFITPRTVEAHLTRIYRKLGLRSRVELAGHFTQVGDGHGEPGGS